MLEHLIFTTSSLLACLLTIENCHIRNSVAYRRLQTHFVWVVFTLGEELNFFELLALVTETKFSILRLNLIFPARCRNSCWLCVVTRRLFSSYDLLLAWAFGLISSGCFWLGWVLITGSLDNDIWGLEDGEGRADKNILAKCVQIIQCLAVHPDFFQTKTGIKFDTIVKSWVWGREFRGQNRYLFIEVPTFTMSLCSTLIFRLLKKQVRLIVVNGLLDSLRNSSVAGSGVNRYATRYLDDWLGQLLHFHFNDQVFQVALSTIVFLLDHKLTLWFSIALNFAFKFVKSINHLSLDRGQIFFQILD